MLHLDAKAQLNAAASCSSLRSACSEKRVLQASVLPIKLPRAVLLRLAGAGNPWALHRLGVEALYQDQDVEQGSRLLRLAAAAGCSDSAFEVYLISTDEAEKKSMMQSALRGRQRAALLEEHRKNRMERGSSLRDVLRDCFVPRLEGPLTAAQVGSTEAQAAALSAAAYLEDDNFQKLSAAGLANCCWARGCHDKVPAAERGQNGGCHRWAYRRGASKDARRRTFLGLPSDAELPAGPPIKLGKCSQCRHARYCSSLCQVLHWPVHRQFCVP